MDKWTAARNKREKIIIENCDSFTDFISEMNNTKIDSAKDIYETIPMYNLIEYSKNHS